MPQGFEVGRCTTRGLERGLFVTFADHNAAAVGEDLGQLKGTAWIEEARSHVRAPAVIHSCRTVQQFIARRLVADFPDADLVIDRTRALRLCLHNRAKETQNGIQ